MIYLYKHILSSDNIASETKGGAQYVNLRGEQNG